MPRLRPKAPSTPPPPKPVDAIDQVTAALERHKLEELASAEPPAETPPTLGAPTGTSGAKMTANELDALRSRLAQCWSPPLGWTDPSEVRTVLLLDLNPDGTVAGQQVVESPQGQYSNQAPESAMRAVRRCAPYNLPADKYDAWRQVKVTFDPRDMSGA